MRLEGEKSGHTPDWIDDYAAARAQDRARRQQVREVADPWPVRWWWMCGAGLVLLVIELAEVWR